METGGRGFQNASWLPLRSKGNERADSLISRVLSCILNIGGTPLGRPTSRGSNRIGLAGRLCRLPYRYFIDASAHSQLDPRSARLHPLFGFPSRRKLKFLNLFPRYDVLRFVSTSSGLFIDY